MTYDEILNECSWFPDAAVIKADLNIPEITIDINNY